MNFSYSKPNKKKIIFLRLLIIIIIIGLIISVSLFIFLNFNKNLNNVSLNKVQKKLYKKLFTDKNYLELITKMDKELKKNPFNPEYLVYRGYSYFLLGEDEDNINKRKYFFNLALIDLRKALAIGINKNNINDVNFTLGKIYFYYGEAYYKQSLQYLTISFENGNKRSDLYHILGVLYSYLGEYEKAIEIFNLALKSNNSELTLLAISDTYFKNNENENAKKSIERLINITTDPKIKEKCFFLLGEIYFNEKKYIEALDYFNNVLSINENNANVYFYKGEIYFINNDLIKARSQWRKTLEIDPSHIKALKRLY